MRLLPFIPFPYHVSLVLLRTSHENTSWLISNTASSHTKPYKPVIVMVFYIQIYLEIYAVHNQWVPGISTI